MKQNTKEWNDFESKIIILSDEKLNKLLKILDIKTISVGSEYPTLTNENVDKGDKIFNILSSTSKTKLEEALNSI